MIKHFRELRVYQNAIAAAMTIYNKSKAFPPEEKYSLTDQIRRSSRSVCANIAEGWRKRRYRAAFIAKLSDAEAEAAETQVWLELALRCELLGEDEFQKLDDDYDKIIAQITRMISQSDRWVIKSED